MKAYTLLHLNRAWVLSMSDIKNVLEICIELYWVVIKVHHAQGAHCTGAQTLYFSALKSPSSLLFPPGPLLSPFPPGQPSSHTISLHCLCSAFQILLSTLCSLFPVNRFLSSIMLSFFLFQFMHIPWQVFSLHPFYPGIFLKGVWRFVIKHRSLPW